MVVSVNSFRHARWKLFLAIEASISSRLVRNAGMEYRDCLENERGTTGSSMTAKVTGRTLKNPP